MMGGEGDEDFEMPQTYTNSDGNFSFNITYRSTYLLIAFYEGQLGLYYAELTPDPYINITDPNQTKWYNFTLDPAEPDTLTMTVQFTDLDDAVVTVNRTVVAASPMLRFGLDFDPENGNNNQNVSQTEVQGYLQALSLSGPTVNASLEDIMDDGGGEDPGAPDFLSTPVSLLLDWSNFDEYMPGSFSGNLDNLVNTTVNDNSTIYYNATFNLTLDGLILNQTNHPLNITTEYNSIVLSNITLNLGSFYNVTSNVTTANVTVTNTTNSINIQPGNGSIDELAYINVSMILNASTISLPIIEVPTWHILDEWVFDEFSGGSSEETTYTVDGKALRTKDRMQYRRGDDNISYLCYDVMKENNSGGQMTYVTVSDLDTIIFNGTEINYLINDVDFPLYGGKTWYPTSWWGESVNATVVSCNDAKITANGTFSCVNITYTNSSNNSHVLGREWYYPNIKNFVNRTRYLTGQPNISLDLKSHSLAPYIESTTIYANDSDSNDLINSFDVNITINASQYYNGPADFMLEGPFYKESSGWGPPTDITWAWEEDELEDLDKGVIVITMSYAGSLINSQQVDGPYDGWLEFRERGSWGPGRTLDFTSFQTDQYNYTQFESPAVSILSTSAFGNDTSGNGKYDYLTVNVTLNVTENGTYSIQGGLDYVIDHGFWQEWRWITGTGENLGTLTQNTTPTVRLNFLGSEIYEKGYDGLYKFHLEIKDETAQTRVVEVEGTAENYTHDQFSTPTIYFDKGTMRQTGMHDYINNSIYLTVNASIMVENGTFGNGSGTYELCGSLHYPAASSNDWGEFITGKCQEYIILRDGANIIPFNIDIGEISEANSSYVGNFTAHLEFSEQIGTWIGPEIDNVEYTTQLYNLTNAASFPQPPITLQVYTDEITNGGDTLNVSAYVNITSDDYSNQIYDLHGGVHYKQGDWWVFITGTGTNVYLDYGQNTVSLDFSGMEIRNSGQDGPYPIFVGLEDIQNHQLIVKDDDYEASHNAGDFSTPQVQFVAGSTSDYDNTSGSQPYLTINASVTVNTPDTYHIGGAVHWIDTLYGWEDWRFITGVGEEITLSSNTTVSLNFGQGAIRDELERVGYSGVLKVHLSIENSSSWQQISHIEHTTGVYSSSDFSAGPVSILSATPSIDNNDNLVVNLTYNATTDDTYNIFGGVNTQDWQFIAGTCSRHTLQSGEHYTNVTFNGGEIYNSKQDGPYTIWIGIENTSTYNLVTSIELTTGAYLYSQFEGAAPGVRILRDNMSTGAVDYMNESGSQSYLTVNVSVNATAESVGTYWIDSGLHSDEGGYWNWITGYGSQITLSEGANIVPLNFNAGDIYSSGKDGPYKVWIGIRNTTTWVDIDHFEYTTQSYTSSDAPRPPIQFISMNDGQNDYLNTTGSTTYITINATLNVSSGYNGTYDLHGGIHYIDQNGWWKHIDGTGEWVTLTAGSQVIPLNFNAGQINATLTADSQTSYNDNFTVWIGLNDVNTWNEITNTEYYTQVYDRNDLPGPAMTMNATSEYVNGSYLTVNLSVNVGSGNAGTYEVHGGIHWIDTSSGWEDWRFITGTGSPVDLIEGVNNIPLNFNAGEIYTTLEQNSYSGKLTVWTGVENTTNWNQITHTEYQTPGDYSSGSFSPPSLTINCVGDYNNATNYLTVNLTINATGSSLNQEYDIHTGIHYRDGWEWRFITGYGETINVTSNMTIPINFAGEVIRSSEQDGPYEVWVGISNAGQWEDITHDEHTTGSYGYVDFAEPDVRIVSGSIEDYANATQYLTVNVTVNASANAVGQTYFLEGGLHWKDGHQWKWITWEGTDVSIGSSGEHTVTLNFDGKQIANAENDGWSGEILVAWIEIRNSTTWRELSRVAEYEMAGYSSSDFTAIPIKFNHSVYPSESLYNLSGGEAPYTHLNVTLSLNVTTQSNYEVFAGLFDVANKTMIVTSNASIGSEDTDVTLSFNGTKIYKKGYNGTFEFRAKLFDTSGSKWFECDNIQNMTASYNYTDFQVGTMEATIVGNYSNFTNVNGDLVVNVTINVVQNQTKYELYADLFDNSTSAYITSYKNETEDDTSWLNNQTGNVTVQLVFNNSEIQNSSAVAPYRLGYLRLSICIAEGTWEELTVEIDPYYPNPGGA